jgi:hypothetical protein
MPPTGILAKCSDLGFSSMGGARPTSESPGPSSDLVADWLGDIKTAERAMRGDRLLRAMILNDFEVGGHDEQFITGLMAMAVALGYAQETGHPYNAVNST